MNKVAELLEEMEGRRIARAFHSELNKIAAKKDDKGPGAGAALLAGGGVYGAYKGLRGAGRRARLLGVQAARRHAGRQATKKEVAHQISEKATGIESGRRASMKARLRSAAKAYKPTPKVTPGLVSATRSVVHTGPGFGAAKRRALIQKVLARR